VFKRIRCCAKHAAVSSQTAPVSSHWPTSPARLTCWRDALNSAFTSSHAGAADVRATFRSRPKPACRCALQFIVERNAILVVTSTFIARRRIQRIEGVHGIHDFHIWQLTGEKLVATVHLQCEDKETYLQVAKKVSVAEEARSSCLLRHRATCIRFAMMQHVVAMSWSLRIALKETHVAFIWVYSGLHSQCCLAAVLPSYSVCSVALLQCCLAAVLPSCSIAWLL